MTGKKLIYVAVLILLAASVIPAQAQSADTSTGTLRLGVFADADSLPFLLAERDSLFAQEGVNVELLRFQSAVERDSAFQAGALDGMISDILAALLSVQGGFPVKITSLTDGRYGIAAAPASNLKNLADLAGTSIASSRNSVIHYMIDTLMAEAGVPEDKIIISPVPKMPIRLEMLLGGQASGAGLPEPFLTTAGIRGATILAATDDYGMGLGVLLFSEKSLKEKLPLIEKLYRAYWKAAQMINASPNSYRQLLVATAGFSKEAAETYRFVVYQHPRLPRPEDMRSASDWLVRKGLLTKPIALQNLTDSRAIQGF
jgi:NitT/TauT family transport system substrate-binding protein